MTNQELEQRLRDWYAVEVGPSEPAPASLYQRLAALPGSVPLDAPTPLYRRMSLLAAAALLLALAAGAVMVGSGLVKLPQLLPPPLVVPVPDPSAPISAKVSPSAPPSLAPTTPAPSDLAFDGPAPWIAFLVDGGAERRGTGPLWAMRADGSGAHEIGDGAPVAWSPDGTRLLALRRAFPDNGHIQVAQVGADIGPFADSGIEEPTAEQWEAFDFAPDGERAVYVRKSKCAAGTSGSGSAQPVVVLAIYTAETPGANCYVLTVLDLRSGELTNMEETLVRDQGGQRPGELELPAWSPDGTRIAYTRTDDRSELWVVNADGTNPTRVELEADVPVREPRWSPDGTRIAFTSETFLSDSGPSTSAVYVADVATGRLERLTTGPNRSDGDLCCGGWLDNTHLRVQVREPAGTYRIWRVALGGTAGEAQVLVDLSDLLAATNAPTVTTVSAPGDPGRTFFWQPIGKAQP